jgi:hypothetical protein
MSTKPKVKNYYVDNAELYRVLKEYKEKDRMANSEETRPKIPDLVGKAIWDIAHKMATKSNFSGYSFIDEMIDDGIENAVAAIRSFNPDKSDNPFGYLTITVYYAFIRRIQKEKKNLYIKYKVAESMLPDVEFQMMGSGETSPLLDILQNPYMVELVNKMETELTDEEKEKKRSGVWKRKAK